MTEILDVLEEQEGRIELEDGSILRLKMTIVDVRETGFSPFGGVNFAIKPTGGIALIETPDKLKELVKDKPVSSGTPEDGWELVKIKSKRTAFEKVKVTSKEGDFKVLVELEPTMVGRNLKYKDQNGDPIYHASWANKASWFPLEEG